MKRILLVTFGTFLLLSVSAQTSTDKMSKFIDVINKFYVEEVDSDTLVELAIKRMLRELDPHSNYYTKEELKKADEPLKGKFEGVGIQFNILDDTILVVNTISGGPSEGVGILAGDKIVIIDNDTVAGISIKNKGVVDRLRGPKGTKVDVRIFRRGEKELLDFTITRDKIPIFAVDASYMANDEVGYIRLSRFSAKSTEEVKRAINELKGQGMRNLILDLTGNTGGYLRQAHAMSDLFLEDGKMIVFTEGRAYKKDEKLATEDGNFEEGKLVIMVDQRSASASEIVSGAVQDWDRGIIVGRRTFGKGLVQKPFYLPDGSAIRLTIANYYTPSGRFIQKPYDDGRSNYRKEINERFESGELIDESKIQFPDSLKYKTSGGRTVYGGGGIMPDIFVAIDTSQSSKFYNKLIRKGILNSFALNYVDQNRAFIEQKYVDLEGFANDFLIDEELLNELYAFAKTKKVASEEEDFSNSLEFLKVQLKALIARNLWKTNAYFRVFNEKNPIYQKALETISNKKLYKKLGINSY